MIGVTGIHAHRDAGELAHEMIFKPGALDLARIIQIFRTDEANDGVDLIRAVAFCETITARFENELIPTIMRFSGKFCTLPGFKIHEVRTLRVTMLLRKFIGFIHHADRDTK